MDNSLHYRLCVLVEGAEDEDVDIAVVGAVEIEVDYGEYYKDKGREDAARPEGDADRAGAPER